MNKPTVIHLDAQSAGFVEAQVASGDYASAEAVVRAGLELLQMRAEKLAALRQALIDGENSGPPLRLSRDELMESLRNRTPTRVD